MTSTSTAILVVFIILDFIVMSLQFPGNCMCSASFVDTVFSSGQNRTESCQNRTRTTVTNALCILDQSTVVLFFVFYFCLLTLCQSFHLWGSQNEKPCLFRRHLLFVLFVLIVSFQFLILCLHSMFVTKQDTKKSFRD